MRRSGSQLRNLSSHAGRRGYGNAPVGNNAATHQYADEIQRRVDALGIGGYAAPMPNPPYNAVPGNSFFNPGQNQNPMYNPEMPFANVPQAHAYQPPMPPMPTHQPMYADFPAPDYQSQGYPGNHSSAANHELNSIKDAIDALGGQLQSMQHHQNHLAQSIAQAPQSNENQNAQIGAVTNEVAELKRIVASVASDQSAVEEIATLRQILETTRAEIASNTSGSVDPDAYARVVETSHSDLTRQIEEMQGILKEGSSSGLDTDIIHRTLEASHDELKAQIEHLQSSINSKMSGAGIGSDKFEEHQQEVIGQLSDIQTMLMENAGISAGDGEQSTAFDSIEMRLEEITRAVVALSHSDPATDSFERIEARVSELSKKLSATSDGITFADTDTVPMLERLDVITQRLDQMADMPSAYGTVGDADETVTATMYEIAQKVDAIDAKMQAVGNLEALGEFLKDPEYFERLQQLSAAAETLDVAPNTQALEQSVEKLEANVGYVVNLLENRNPESSPEFGDDLARKLASIEEQVVSNRDISIDMATKIAQETVERVMDQIHTSSAGTASSDSTISVLSGLSDDIHKLQEASTETNAQNLNAFSAIKDTLGSMVDRLSVLEEDTVQISDDPSPAHYVDQPAYHAEQTDAAKAPVVSEAAEAPHAQSAPDYEENIVPTIPSIDEFDDPVRLTSEEKEEKATGQDMVAEYRALVAEQQASETADNTGNVSIAQSLVDEAARAEEERERLRASMSPGAMAEHSAGEHQNLANDREFHSSEMAIETFEEDLSSLPSVEVPEIATPDNVPQNEMPDFPMEVEDSPLEPGAVGPDLAALVRKANETRKNRSKNGEGSSGTDFIAAARRAAQAAAEEASAAHEEVIKQEKDTEKGMLSSIPSLFSKRKKIISMAAVATLLAAISVPFIVGAIGASDEEQVAQSNSVPAQTEILESASSETNSATAPRIVDAAPTNPQNEEIVVASLGQSDTGKQTEQSVSSSVDSSLPASDLDYVNDALKTAVTNGEVTAIFEVGRRHLEGVGVEKSAETALEWYTHAAEKGYAPAQYIVANFNEKGIGVERNIPEAIKWYEKAAGNGNVISMHNLAVLHATPNAVNPTPDTAAAFKWFKSAANYGVRDSLVNLAIFYTKGVGTETDLVQAYKWFTLAAKSGDEDAAKKREVVTEYMRPDQLALAKTQIEDWRPTEQDVFANVYAPRPEWQPVLANVPISDNPEAVKKAQALLGRLGYDAGPADGIMGAKTKQAIAEFQQRVGLGINGEITRELLSELEAVAI